MPKDDLEGVAIDLNRDELLDVLIGLLEPNMKFIGMIIVL